MDLIYYRQCGISLIELVMAILLFAAAATLFIPLTLKVVTIASQPLLMTEAVIDASRKIAQQNTSPVTDKSYLDCEVKGESKICEWCKEGEEDYKINTLIATADRPTDFPLKLVYHRLTKPDSNGPDDPGDPGDPGDTIEGCTKPAGQSGQCLELAEGWKCLNYRGNSHVCTDWVRE